MCQNSERTDERPLEAYLTKGLASEPAHLLTLCRPSSILLRATGRPRRLQSDASARAGGIAILGPKLYLDQHQPRRLQFICCFIRTARLQSRSRRGLTLRGAFSPPSVPLLSSVRLSRTQFISLYQYQTWLDNRVSPSGDPGALSLVLGLTVVA